MWKGVRHRKLRKLQEQFADPETRSVRLNIRFHKGADQIWAEVVGVPGLATQGQTARDLMNNLSEAISLYFDVELDYPVHHGQTLDRGLQKKIMKEGGIRAEDL